MSLRLRREPARGGLRFGPRRIAATTPQKAVAYGLLEADPDGLQHPQCGAREVVALRHPLEPVDGPLEVLPGLVEKLEMFPREQYVDGGHHDDGIEGAEEQRVCPMLRRVERRELLPLRLQHV